MKLIEALTILREPIPEDAPELRLFLASGFTPLYLKTFLAAQLRGRFPQHRVVIDTGLYGDLAGNIERLEPARFRSLVVIAEWEDLDPRLGIRRLGGWRPLSLADIEESAQRSADRLKKALLNATEFVSTVVCMPTLPLPPLFWMQPDRSSSTELRLREKLASLAVALSGQPRVQVANAELLSELSPIGQRFDLNFGLIAGFPYTLPHASALASLIANLIDNQTPKKGLITDLDDTLWAGILGEDGISGISWDMEHRTHVHGLYQQFVASLAGAGVLVAVASKNDPALVEQAFDRSDLLISKSEIFPFEVGWSRKSESVSRILDTWNVGADSVVFIDDSPAEIAEVKAAFTELECILFPRHDLQGIWNLLKDLRRFFGKSSLTEDDSLRLNSIRSTIASQAQFRSTDNTLDDFLRAAESTITFSLARNSGDIRALELINKTNQFNLNGRRINDSEWQHLLSDPASLMLVASYRDKYGSLGKIAVILATFREHRLFVHNWVMSCRAFSRRIEHQCLKYLFDTFGANEVVLDYQPTLRNAPLQTFLGEFLSGLDEPVLRITRERFEAAVPQLFHQIEG